MPDAAQYYLLAAVLAYANAHKYWVFAVASHGNMGIRWAAILYRLFPDVFVPKVASKLYVVSGRRGLYGVTWLYLSG
jgi:hypothetical protein